MLGHHPGAADAALLLGCPCDAPPWRDHASIQQWPQLRERLDALLQALD